MWPIILAFLGGAGKLAGSVIDATTTRTVAGFALLSSTIKTSGNVMIAAMNHNIYWYVWGGFGFFSLLWYGWGMVDTACSGCLPIHTAVMPKTLQATYDIVINSIFWSGTAGFAVHTVGRLGDSLIKSIFGGR